MKHDVIIRTQPHQLTAYQVLGVMLDAMRENRSVRCWLIVPKGTEVNWMTRIRVVLAKQRKLIYTQVTTQKRDAKDAIFGRLFSLNFSNESVHVNKYESAVLVKYYETAAHRRGRLIVEHLGRRGIL